MADGPFDAGDFTVIGTEHPPNLKLLRHDHEAATMVIVRSGEFEETVGSKSFRCTPGTVLIKPAGAHHSNRYESAGSASLLAALPPAVPVREVRVLRNSAAMRRLAFEFRCRDGASALVCEILLLELLQEPWHGEPDTQRAPASWLRSVEERLRSEPLAGVAAIAAEVQRDPVHLAREFRRHYGCSPGEYARSVRIERSCEMLRRSNESVVSIAIDLGFYDQSHFTNVFRRVLGTTPAEYRRRAGPISHRSSKTR
jgi:AraC family transcriptional regulator